MSRISGKQPTKERIIEVAQRLFAEKGLDGTSMREITDQAGVNLASVNYHFGSKDGLISTVFDRHLTPLNEARLAMLCAVEEAAGGRAACLEEVLEAFIRPAVMHASDPHQNNDSFLRLMGRCLSEPPAYAEKHIYPRFKNVIERFNEAARRLVPGVSPDEVFWGMGFIAGALHYALHMWSTDSLPFKPGKPMDAEELIRQLVSFAAAGLRSKAAAQY